jgi:hypothetical protein
MIAESMSTLEILANDTTEYAGVCSAVRHAMPWLWAVSKTREADVDVDVYRA